MAINIATQINFLLSGGALNNKPNRSLGGPASTFPVVGTTNSLFSDVTTEEAQVGKTDYRCFYIKNSSTTDSLFNASVFIFSEKFAGSSAQIGVSFDTDEQEIRITGVVSSGFVLFKYKQQQISVVWDGANNFAANLLAGLHSIGLTGAEVTPIISSAINRFRIVFKQPNNFRNHPLLDIYSNSLEGNTKPVIEVRKINEGKPINSIAPLIEAETIIPSKVQFLDTSPTEKINLGTIGPGDFVPIWIKRTTLPDTPFEEDDFFTLKITGSPLS